MAEPSMASNRSRVSLMSDPRFLVGITTLTVRGALRSDSAGSRRSSCSPSFTLSTPHGNLGFTLHLRVPRCQGILGGRPPTVHGHRHQSQPTAEHLPGQLSRWVWATSGVGGAGLPWRAALVRIGGSPPAHRYPWQALRSEHVQFGSLYNRVGAVFRADLRNSRGERPPTVGQELGSGRH